MRLEKRGRGQRNAGRQGGGCGWEGGKAAPPLHEAPRQRQREMSSESQLSRSAQVCLDVNTDRPKSLCPNRESWSLSLPLPLLPAPPPPTSSFRNNPVRPPTPPYPHASSPNSPSSGRLRKDRAIQASPWLASASEVPCVAEDRNDFLSSEAQSSPRLPRGWQMWCLISPALIPPCPLPGGLVPGSPECERGRGRGTSVRETGQHHVTQDATGWWAKERSLREESGPK